MPNSPVLTPYALDGMWPIKKSHALFSLAVIMTLGILDFVDRQVMAALFPYLKAEYSLTDTQLGMLVSIVNLSMAVFVIPTAYFVDRWSRKKMIAIMAAVWSCATGMCAFAGSFAHLLIARFFIGTGEAGYNSAGQSLLAASFPERWRSTALAAMQCSMLMGAPVGLLLGAFIAEHWGWRHAFGIVALPGLFLACLALFMKDFTTPKPHAEAEHTSDEQKRSGTSWWRIIRTLLSMPSFLLALLAQACTALVNGTMMNWLPSYYIREGGMAPTEASMLSAVFLFAVSIATLTGGPILDFLRRKTPDRVNLSVALFLMTGFFIFSGALLFCKPASTLQVSLFIIHTFFIYVVAVQCYTLVAELAPAQYRGTAVSLAVTSLNVFGYAVGPLLTGIISDHFSLSVSLIVVSCFYALSSLLFIAINFRFKVDAAKVEKVEIHFN